jgi:hypothetical protein
VNHELYGGERPTAGLVGHAHDDAAGRLITRQRHVLQAARHTIEFVADTLRNKLLGLPLDLVVSSRCRSRRLRSRVRIRRSSSGRWVRLVGRVRLRGR